MNGRALPRRGRCGPPARRYDVGSVISMDLVVCSAVRLLGHPTGGRRADGF